MKILSGRYVVTMDTDRRVLERGGVAFEGDRIVAVDGVEQLAERFPECEILGGDEFVVLPGLVNAHMHLACSLWRGYIDDMPLIEHDVRFLFPGQRAMNNENVYAASLLSSLELLKNGVTTTADAYLYPAASARAILDSGLRGVVSPSMMDTWLGELPGPVITSTRGALDAAEELHSEWNGAGDGRIAICPAPFTDLTASPELIRGCAELARKWESVTQIHMCETLEGVNLVKRRYGKRVFEYAESCGLFESPHVVAAHCCWLSESDIAIIKKYDVAVAYCPSCEAKMSDGLPPITRLLSDGVCAAIAIDATCVNNSADLLHEAKIGALLQKVAPPLDPEVVPVERALEMVTINGARALGLEKAVGSLEVGKRADLIALRIDRAHYVPLLTAPRYTVINHLIYSANGADVAEVYVNGRHVVHDHQILTLDEREVIKRAQQAFEEFVDASGIASQIDPMRWGIPNEGNAR
jgi:5-methylthioadenosine/S-adenosylhomocysteine deaminase